MMNAQLVGLSREVALRRELDVIANNLANMNTTAFQAERMLLEDHRMPKAEGSAFQRRDRDVAFVQDWASYRDLEPGARRVTGNPLDIALSAGGYLAVETPEGLRYTRNGSLQINDQGQLVTAEGFPVISLGGTPIQFDPTDTDITIGGAGQITTNNAARGTLQLVSCEDELQLERLGNNLFAAPNEPDPDASIRVTQGMLETSNVAPIREMARLVEVQRAYESQANMLRQSDQMRREAIRTLGQLNA